MPILVHFKAKNNDNSYFYKNSGLSFPWVPYYVKSFHINVIKLDGYNALKTRLFQQLIFKFLKLLRDAKKNYSIFFKNYNSRKMVRFLIQNIINYTQEIMLL